MTLSMTTLSITIRKYDAYVKCCYAESHSKVNFVGRRYAECCYAECRGANKSVLYNVTPHKKLRQVLLIDIYVTAVE
jgi:hypothetical protein